MLDLDDRLDELAERGLERRVRLVSGPQGPRVVLDGRPVLLLCSGNCLGLADHPHVRRAAAEAAMRWGAGAGAARTASGTMTMHRRLEERLAGFAATDAAVLFGSGTLANLGVVGALVRPGEVVFHDELCHASIPDACRLAGAEAFVFAHGDMEQLAWGLRHAAGSAALIATEAVFRADGSIAPLDEIARLARRHGVRVLVDESHATGVLGPGGRGAVAEAGLEGEVDVVTGSLGTSLGSYGGYACTDRVTARYLLASSHPLLHSTAPSPVAVAAALAALELLASEPRRVEKLHVNAAELRRALARQGCDVPDTGTHVTAIATASPERAEAIARAALDGGVFVEAADERVRLAVMSSHTRGELREAAAVVAAAAA